MKHCIEFICFAALLTFLGGCGDDAPLEAAVPATTTVRAVEVQRGSVRAWVVAEGSARAVRREYLSFDNPGRVTFVRPAQDGGDLRAGEAVKANDLLAHQDQRQARADVDVAKSELTQAETDQRLAESTFERFRVLLGQESASQQEYDEAQAKVETAAASVDRGRARLRQVDVELRKTELRSPIDGIVAYLNLDEGYYVSSSSIRTDSEQGLLETIPALIIDPSSYEITVAVPSFERNRVAVGQRAAVMLEERTPGRGLVSGNPEDDGSVDPLDEFAIRGAVHSVNPAISPGGRTVQVKVRTTSGAELLRDGMFVNVWIESRVRDGVPVVPLDAIQFIDNAPYAYVVDRETGIATRRPLELGLMGFSRGELRGGARPGDFLVTDGKFRIHDGARVRLLDDLPDGSSRE